MDKLTDLIEDNENELEKIRSLFFPKIENNLITGYNLYFWRDVNSENFTVNYLHAHDEHNNELKDKILNDKLSKKVAIQIEKPVIKRYATYSTNPNWDTQEMRYFNLNGNQVSRQEARKLINEDRKIIIGEAIQTDFEIQLDDEEQLRVTLDLIKKYAPKYELNRIGARVFSYQRYKLNKNRVKNYSWEIPLVTVKSKQGKKPKCIKKDFLFTREIIVPLMIDKILAQIKTLVHPTVKRKLEDSLRGDSLDFILERRYVLRAFREEYLFTQK